MSKAEPLEVAYHLIAVPVPLRLLARAEKQNSCGLTIGAAVFLMVTNLWKIKLLDFLNLSKVNFF